MTTFHARRQKMRAIFSGERTVFAASVFDPMSIRAAEALGFEIGMFAGSVASMVVLGAPDIVVLTLTEFVEQCRRMTRASDLPLMVDADHGYGNALNVMRTVEELEAAGVCGLTVEDTELPAAYGAAKKTRLIGTEEAAAKMRAAVAARRDKNLVIVGRTGAVRLTNPADAVERAKAYERTGVDAIMIVGATKREELDAVANAVKLPIMLGNAPGDLADLDYLNSRRVCLALQGNKPVQSGIEAVYATLKAQAKANGLTGAELSNADLLKRVMSEDAYERWTKEFL